MLIQLDLLYILNVGAARNKSSLLPHSSKAGLSNQQFVMAIANSTSEATAKAAVGLER